MKMEEFEKLCTINQVDEFKIINTVIYKGVSYDGIGRTVRNGLNITERGFGIRKSLGIDIINRVPEEIAPQPLSPGESLDMDNGYNLTYTEFIQKTCLSLIYKGLSGF